MNSNGNGLRAVLEDSSDGRRGWLGRLTVLAAGNDPFRTDTTTGHRNGEWLARHVDEFGLGDRTIHLRGVHYALIGRTKPDGLPYENDDPTWTWLQGTVGKQARWLGYVGFDQIHDERNAPPLIRLHKEVDPEPYLTVGVEVEIPEAEDIVPRVEVEGFVARQLYKLVFIGEKSSLEPVLGPLADSYKADLYLPTGEISDTQIYTMAKVAAEDGRRMMIFYFADCDPSGWQMGISVARKLQAFRASHFHEIEFELRRVALTPDHVREYGLPSTPLKETERRASKWTELMGVEQTEIDAIATLQPDLLRTLTRQAVNPFFDRTLSQRVKDARDSWLTEAQATVDGAFDQTQLETLKAEAEERLAELREQIEEINRSLQLAVPNDIEFPIIEVPEPQITANGNGLPLIDSDWSYLEQTERLIAEKAYIDA